MTAVAPEHASREGDPVAWEWLEAAAERLRTRAGDAPEGYRLAGAQIESLLGLAGVAAREGGHKANAPLLSYLVGLAHGRHPELGLDELIRAAARETLEART